MSITATIGWIGAVSFIIAYALLSLGRLRSDRSIYHLLNAVGGLCLVVNAYSLTDMPALAVNLVWMGIAVLSIIRIYLTIKKEDTKPFH